ncbi:hypothetical protein J5N97_022584 [Dioscorea zingiberensis]|uniref:DUF7148 domain-containing protein n=1 Tax=Dioscorea zingiberensis TaxID=325984 RepID=A0A9D5HAZ6_9LILI|nr:hypothetical protein J5N97_022584 [Dioscorea zingiberensis]
MATAKGQLFYELAHLNTHSQASYSFCQAFSLKAKTEFSGRHVSLEKPRRISVSLPLHHSKDVDVARFETLLFQWANSLCQGANLPLPVPLKVDKIKGGARLGFIRVDDGKTEVRVYIDCLVFPATESSGPLFRAIRNGTLKEQAAPGEPRIMRSLLQALQKSVEIAKL